MEKKETDAISPEIYQPGQPVYQSGRMPLLRLTAAAIRSDNCRRYKVYCLFFFFSDSAFFHRVFDDLLMQLEGHFFKMREFHGVRSPSTRN